MRSRRWEGIDALIFCGDSPGARELGSRLLSGLEPHFDGIFLAEDYESAFARAKASRNVGLVWLVGEHSSLPLHAVLAQLSKPLEAKGWPCFGVLVIGGAPRDLDSWRALHREGRMLQEIAPEELAAPADVEAALERVGKTYLAALGERILPPAMRESLLAFAHPELDRESALFRERVAHLLMGAGSGVSLSMLESLAVLWSPLIAVIESKAPALLAPHPMLKDLHALTHQSAPGNGTYVSRIHYLTGSLDEQRREGTLALAARELSARAPDSARDALDRRLHAIADRLAVIAREVSAAATDPEAA